MLKRLTIIWTRNRTGMPQQALKNTDVLWNHIVSESELSKKHLLASNIFAYLESPQADRFKDVKHVPSVLDKP